MRWLLLLSLLGVVAMPGRGDGDWNDDDLPFTYSSSRVSGDLFSDQGLPIRLLDPTTGNVLLTTNTDPALGDVGLVGLKRGVQTNVENGDFSQGPPDPDSPISATNPLPGWTWTPADNGQLLVWVANDAYASGYVVQPQTTTLGTSTGSLNQYVPVPRSQGQQWRTMVSGFSVGGATRDRLYWQFYQADQTTAIGSEQTQLWPGVNDNELKIDAGLVPPKAAYLLIRIVFSNAEILPLSEVRVAFLPAEATVGLKSNTADVGAISTSETQVIGTTIPANTLVSGSVYKIWAAATLTDTGAARVVTFNVRLGPTTLTGSVLVTMNPTSSGSASGDDYILEGTLTIFTSGATGTVKAALSMLGRTTQPFAVGHRVEVEAATVTIDTTVANIIELTAVTSNVSTTTTFRQAYIQCVMAS